MKKSVLLFAACLLFFSCSEDRENYGTMILGSWEIKDMSMDIAGATDETLVMIREVMREKFNFTGETFVFHSDNTVTYSQGGGTYSVNDNKIRITPENGDPLNMTITTLNNRSLVTTYDAVAEQPTLALLLVTKCMVTITASSKNDKTDSAE